MSGLEGKEVATLAGGCFWCTEAAFQEVEGVESVVPGYSGGIKPAPTYEEVSTGRTGHAESVQVTFDPSVISYREILEIFFSIHDPTTPNRQGADVGTQYRSAIFYQNDGQKETAEEVVDELNRSRVWDKSIVTQIAPFQHFYPAEEYHRNYFSRHPGLAYCQVVVAPKINKLRLRWSTKLKK